MMSKEKRRVPKLRFPGFTEDWEQRKLGECIDISTGYPFDSQDFNENGEYLVITNGNIQENTPFVLNNVGNRIDLDDSLKKYILDIDDLLITMDGTVGRVAIVVNNKLVLAQRVCRIKSNEPYYIYQLLSKNNFIQSMNKIGHGGTIKHISLSEISEYQDFYPKSQKERIKISTVLTNCDKLITLHQRKLNNLKLKRKALLQKLFPKNGEGYPELRFPGFTDAWEQRKLGDFYTFKNGLNKEKVYFGYGDSIVNFTDVFHNRQIYSSTLKGKVCVNKKELENYKVKEGDLFFTRTSETIDEIGFPAVVMEPMERVVFSGFVLRGRAEKYDPLANIFKSYIFFTDNFRSEMKKKSSMTTRALTSGTALKEMCFSYPKDLEEQTKIGEILLSLDKIITLHQRKLKHLQIQKKSLLQKLFV